ncbi:hypothetical protein [Azohydromonas australica]|uniref:hypothetical protein n=1 Tax=Azohydromonas australica TaxID=364039 RepID=UPI0012EB3229|nr:hypothetical protein [Azohydromonas australica]
MSLLKLKSYDYHDVYVLPKVNPASRIAFVSFSAWSMTGVGTIFGHAFFGVNGIPAYFVVQRKNVWYRSSDIEEIAFDICAHAKSSGLDLVLYGASMGGYAAVNFRSLFGAIHSIAIAPQVLILPENAPFEPRWMNERKEMPMGSIAEVNNLSRQRVPLLVFFDPNHSLDRQHIENLKRISGNCDGDCVIEVPYANHDVARALVKSKVIQRCLIAMAEYSPIDVDSFRQQCANLFRQDPKAFLNYYRNVVSVSHAKLGHDDYFYFLSFMEKTKDFDFEACYMAAEIYAKLESREAALAMSQASLDRYPREIPNYLHLKHTGILKKFGIVSSQSL